MPRSSKALCQVEIMGRVSSLSSIDTGTPLLLASTILNGSHVFSLSEEPCEPRSSAPTGISATQVETFSSPLVEDTPFLSSCWIPNGGNVFALGSSNGEVVAVCRKPRNRIGSCVVTGCHIQEKSFSSRILSLRAIQHRQAATLACQAGGASIVDLSRMCCTTSFADVAPRAVGALSVDSNVVAMANYDGKVLLFDVRTGTHLSTTKGKADCVISVPDQICSFSMCDETGAVCAGTASGRVFVLRCCHTSSVRERAFAIGHERRSPIRALAVKQHTVVTGDIAGRVAILDMGDNPSPTEYWTPKELFTHYKREREPSCVNIADEASSTFMPSSISSPTSPNWNNAEVTAVGICGRRVWGAFCVHGTDHSYLAGLPL